MKVYDIINEDFKLMSQQDLITVEFQGCYATDLLSAAIKSSKPGNILITIISHMNTIATAMMVDLPVIIFTESRKIDQVMLDKANEVGIAIISTPLLTHEVIINLNQRGLI
ncbi:MAG: hypothetical protein KKH01_03235 [Firmicutes bacterium]|nr:hypothetical protein [Bacillota bacterium]